MVIINTNNINVLIVDDEPQIATLVSDYLQIQGANTCAAKDGVDAFHLLNSSKFDLVITDFNMPRMSGLELIEKIRANDSFNDIKIILTTGRADGCEFSRALSLSDEMLYKPFNLKRLGNIIESLCY